MLDFISDHLLSLMIFLPIAGAFILLFVRNADAVRVIAIGFSLAELASAYRCWPISIPAPPRCSLPSRPNG